MARIIPENIVLKAELNNGSTTTGAVRTTQQKLADVDPSVDLTDTAITGLLLAIPQAVRNVLAKSIYQTTITQVGQLTN